MEPMTLVGLISLIASIASLVLAIVAIWLSLMFYFKSNEAFQKISDVSKEISSNVDKVEDLFSKLYTDTFSTLKDTMTSMGNYIWGEDQVGKGKENPVDVIVDRKAEARISELNDEIDKRLSVIASEAAASGSVAITKARKGVRNFIAESLTESRLLEQKTKNEAIEEILNKSLREELLFGKEFQVARLLILAADRKMEIREVIDAIKRMSRKGLFELDSNEITDPGQYIRVS